MSSRITTEVLRQVNWAFDLFQSLNATGTPLTAFETFKPSVVNCMKSKGLEYKDSAVEQNYKIFGVEGRVDDEEDQLRGIVDLILEDQETGELFVIDYKTGKVKAISNFRLELCIYRKLIEHKYPNSLFRLELMYAIDGEQQCQCLTKSCRILAIANETVCVVVDATKGIELMTRRMMEWAKERNLCRMIVRRK